MAAEPTTTTQKLEPLTSVSTPNVSTEPAKGFTEENFCMTFPELVIVGLNCVVSLVIILFYVYLVYKLQFKKKTLRAIDESLMAVKNLTNTINYAELPMSAIVLLCEAHEILWSKVLLDYELDSMQRRASVYAAFGIADAFSSAQPNREGMDFYKQFVDKFLNWGQNTYMRVGRFGEQKLIEAYGLKS